MTEPMTPTGGARVFWRRFTVTDDENGPIVSWPQGDPMPHVPGIEAVAAEMARQGEGARTVTLPKGRWLELLAYVARCSWDEDSEAGDRLRETVQLATGQLSAQRAERGEG